MSPSLVSASAPCGRLLSSRLLLLLAVGGAFHSKEKRRRMHDTSGGALGTRNNRLAVGSGGRRSSRSYCMLLFCFPLSIIHRLENYYVQEILGPLRITRYSSPLLLMVLLFRGDKLNEPGARRWLGVPSDEACVQSKNNLWRPCSIPVGSTGVWHPGRVCRAVIVTGYPLCPAGCGNVALLRGECLAATLP